MNKFTRSDKKILLVSEMRDHVIRTQLEDNNLHLLYYDIYWYLKFKLIYKILNRYIIIWDKKLHIISWEIKNFPLTTNLSKLSWKVFISPNELEWWNFFSERIDLYPVSHIESILWDCWNPEVILRLDDTFIVN